MDYRKQVGVTTLRTLLCPECGQDHWVSECDKYELLLHSWYQMCLQCCIGEEEVNLLKVEYSELANKLGVKLRT